MRTIVSFAALFVSAIFVQLGSGSLGPLDALSGAVNGFSNADIGLLGSAHFLGFFIGCVAAPRIMGQVGHARAFGALASMGIISALLHPVIVDPIAWAIFRVGTGIAVSGGYTVLESWMHGKLDNKNRGRVVSIYRTVDLTGSLGAQLMIVFLEPAAYVSYNIVAIFCCLCLLPLLLTQRTPPAIPKAPRLRPLKALRLSPLAIAGVVVAGVTGASFRMVGPLYGQINGLTTTEIGLFLAAAVLGGAAAQIPAGWLADKFDRRWVMIFISTSAIAVCSVVTMLGTINDFHILLIISVLFGAATFPLFSVSGAHANDFAPADFVVELNAALILFYALGAIASPLLVAWLMGIYGANVLFSYTAAAHVLLVIFGFYRMTRRPVTEQRKPYAYLPRTSLIFGRLLRGRRHNGKNGNKPQGS